VTAAVASALALAISAAVTATADNDRNDDGQNDKDKIIYSSIPKKLPGNVASVGPEAYAFKEVGDGLVFTPGAGGILDHI
jgi:hypothetical protein